MRRRPDRRGISRAAAGLVLGALLPGLLVLVALTGCSGPGPGASAGGTVAAFARALREDRHEDAYQLMSQSYRRRVSLADFRRHLEENPEETRDAAHALARPDGPAEETAVVRFADGDRVELRREGGSFRIATNVVDFYDQSSPRATLRSFLRAMERERYDVVLRMVPNADREGMSEERMREAWSGDGREEIERLLEALRQNLEAPIEEVGDRATMPYGDRFTAELVREDGVWKVEDPD